MSLIEKANSAYYNKEEEMLTDSEFDLLSDNGLEMSNFRHKVDHFQPMGSLKKIKTEKDFEKWRQGKGFKVTPKLDGNSVEIIIVDGKFAQAITRGDGFVGNDISDKVQHCNIIHNVIEGEKHYSIKCEALMKKEHQKDYDKNLRNVVAGILNRKTVKPEELAKIDIIPFVDLDFMRFGQLTYQELEEGYEAKKEIFLYDIDGLVVELLPHIHEEKDDLLPANIMALKFNKEGVDAEVGEIEWGLGKHSKLTPVICLKDGVEIDGTTVKRVSASNWSLLVEAGLGIGAKIQVIKSGDIIPFVSKVVEKSDDHVYPNCPTCGHSAVLNETEVNMICPNLDCAGKTLIKLQHVFKTFDLDYISDSTVENLYNQGVNTIDNFFRMTVGEIVGYNGFGMSKARNIVSKLKNVSLNEAQVLKCAMVQGISESNGQRLIDHYENIENFLNSKGKDHTKIDGFAAKTADVIDANMDSFKEVYNTLKQFITIKTPTPLKSTEIAVNIVFTGKCERFARKELTQVLLDNNFTVQKSINKDTDVLLTADPNSKSSKTKKADKLGVQILSYDEFFKENKI